MVADGHLTDIPVNSVYSGVVSLRGLRLIIFLGEHNALEIGATDIRNAYLEAKTKEILFIFAGPEFGMLEGHILVIYKGCMVSELAVYAGMKVSLIVCVKKDLSHVRLNLISG